MMSMPVSITASLCWCYVKFCSIFKSGDVIHKNLKMKDGLFIFLHKVDYSVHDDFFDYVLDSFNDSLNNYSLNYFMMIHSYNSASKIFILDWESERKTLEALLSETMGTKSRTASCYSLIGMAVKYIYDANEQTFLELGHPWEEMIEEFLPGRFRDAVRLTHPEISRPDLLLKNFLRDLISYARGLTISQRKRKLCLAETMKTGTRQAVLGIRISEFRILNGIPIEQIQKVN